MRRLVVCAFLVGLMGLMAVSCTKANARRDKQGWKDNQIVRADSTSPMVRELAHFIDSICPTLNGTLIIARHDTILVERACGYLQLFHHVQ